MAKNKTYDLIVIGSGPAGEKAAVKAAYFGKNVALIEKSPDAGGAGVQTGTLPSKTLKETALYFSRVYEKQIFERSDHRLRKTKHKQFTYRRDGDTLSYSITAGNANSYFAIDSNTGNITTTQTNIPAGTYTITVQVDDGNGGTATADVTITVTASTTPALYCPSPYSTTTLLTPSGDCDEDGITNQTEGFDPDGDGNPSTGTAPIDTDGDGKPDYLDLDSDNDGILDTEEKGTLANSSTNPSDVDSDGTPDFRDLDSDNDSTKDVLESGRNNLDTNNDGRIDGTTNTYGIPSSAASTTNPKALASTSLKDSDNNGTPDYRQSSRNGAGVLAKTGESTITALALATLSLVGAVLAKARRARV